MSSGISSHVKTNIEAYMVEKLGIEESKIENLGNLLYKNYGTTMAGLRVNTRSLEPTALFQLLIT
jgi:putative hydrolase of the HAD superfamily